MDTTRPVLENSNPIQLSWREWGITALLCLIAVYLLPILWPAAGRRIARSDYRLPTELSSDYWMFGKWSAFSRGHYRAVVLGDSVVWGQYVRYDDTLSHHLNELIGDRALANLGVDGLHPAAMTGLVTYYGGAITGEPVMVHLNPLWMSSPEQDLQARGDVRFNHPKLLPQVFRLPGSYYPTPPEVADAVLERGLPFFSWKEHLKIAYCEGMGFEDWSLENPYTLPSEGRGPDSFPSDEPGSEPMNWQKRGITPKNLPWVEAVRSYQWRSFQRAIELLRSRGNRVFVLVGPFNTYALTRGSQARYQRLKAAMEAWLRRERIPYHAARLLPSEMYADASHPLGTGYRRIARELLVLPAFKAWITARTSRLAGPKQ